MLFGTNAMLPEVLQFSRLRLGDPPPPHQSSWLKLVAALVVGDAEVTETALDELQGLGGAAANSRVETPFGGAALFPLQAAVCAPLEPAESEAVARRLLALGAACNIRWRDCGGEHTPLSKALLLRNFRLAETLVQHGADCTAALLRTDLLEGSRFDPVLLRWLLDRGADVATPLRISNTCSATPGCRPTADAGCCCCPAVPATAVLLRKLQQELHMSRQLSKLHVAAGTGQEQWLLRRAADSLVLLLAAGALPAAAQDPSGAISAAIAAMAPADWATVQTAASRPPRWTPEAHRLFPRPYRIAARQVLLVARRGFAIPTAGSGGVDGSAERSSSGAGSGELPPPPHQQQRTLYWLDGHVVLNIVRQLAPCSQR